MNSYEITALEATVDALDQETARRVARLVVECRVSIPLALSAVQDANSSALSHSTRPRRRLTRLLAYLGAH